MSAVNNDRNQGFNNFGRTISSPGVLRKIKFNFKDIRSVWVTEVVLLGQRNVWSFFAGPVLLLLLSVVIKFLRFMRETEKNIKIQGRNRWKDRREIVVMQCNGLNI